jgi:nucleoside-triphosphatase THEP1
MAGKKTKIILITGAVTSGKTTLLSSLAGLLATRWKVDGFLAKAPHRIHCSAQFASGYVLYRLGKQETYPWATPRKNNRGYVFDPDTQDFLDQTFAQKVVDNGPDILFLDELGKLELTGAGLEKVLYAAIRSDIDMLVCTVKKRFINEILEKYDFQTPLCIDLDTTDSRVVTQRIIQYINFPQL